MRFANKVALITGAGSGIGAATARLLAKEGAAIGVMGRTAATVERTVRAVVEAKGRAISIVGDVSKERDAERAVRETVAAFGRLDIVVSNAGIQLHQRDKPIHEQGLDAWEETQAVNLRGAFLVCRAVAALIASAPQNPAYTASKGGLHAFGRALAVQYAPQGIRCNIVAPGALEQPPDGEQVDLVAREKRMIGKIPMGRIGRFDEIAPMVAFLASNEASYCTGGVYVVDGGFTVQ